MIKLNINEKKKLQFDVSVSGIMAQDLRGSMKIVMENIQYAFPITMVEGKVVVEIPALNNYIKPESVTNEKMVSAKLEIIADSNYIVPWEDQVMIESPVKVEAVMSDIETIMEKELPKIKINSVSKVVVDDKIKESCSDDHEEKKKKKKKSKLAKAME